VRQPTDGISFSLDGNVEYCSWQEIEGLVQKMATNIRTKTMKKYDGILAITNGGIIPARLLAEELGITRIMLIPVRNKRIVSPEMPHLEKTEKYLIVDDIYDTGNIYQKVSRVVQGFDCTFVFCMSRHHQEFGDYAKLLDHERWVIFPWERTRTGVPT
jgi:hypoxanthine phosphoribosyltransferase